VQFNNLCASFIQYRRNTKSIYLYDGLIFFRFLNKPEKAKSRHGHPFASHLIQSKQKLVSLASSKVKSRQQSAQMAMMTDTALFDPKKNVCFPLFSLFDSAETGPGDILLPLACPDDTATSDGLEGVEGAASTLAPAPLLSNLGRASANGYRMDLTVGFYLIFFL